MQSKAPVVSRMRFLLAIVCMLALPSLGFGEIEDEQTYGFANGRMWAKLTDPQRTSFVIGLSDGLTAPPARPDIQLYTCDCTFGELKDGISALYASDPAYARVPILMMFRLQVAKTKGVTREQIEKQITEYLSMLSLFK